MRQASITLLLAAALSSGLGCAAQSNIDQARELNRKQAEQIVELQTRLEEQNELIASLRGTTNPNDALSAQLESERQRAAELEAALREAEAALADAGRQPMLPERLASQLEALARQNPGLMTFDKALGMVKLQSDLTFDLGSTTVKPAAQQSLGQLARVLNGQAAQPYDIRVVGHTDNVPVTNAANKQKFEDNWGLSAFRAKRVMEELKKAGLSADRFIIAGRGETQPMVANPAEGGARENRRVEIFLVAQTAPSSAPAADTGAAEDESDAGGPADDADAVEDPGPSDPADDNFK